MKVYDDDPHPGYVARFKAATVNDFEERMANMDGIQPLQIASALDPRYKPLKFVRRTANQYTGNSS